MKPFLAFLLIALFWLGSTLIMIGLSTGIGFALHRIWPQVEAGAWILVSLVAGALSFRLILRLLAKVEDLELEENQKNEEQETELIITHLPLRLPFAYRSRKKRSPKRKTGD